MQKIITQSISFQCEISIPRHMVLVFSENPDDEEAKGIYTLLRDKGILCDCASDYFSYKNASGNSEDKEYSGCGLLLYLNMAEESILFSFDEANEWIKSLPYGRIIVDGKDYTSAAELYSAIIDLSDEMEAQYYMPHQKENVTKEKVSELAAISKRTKDLYKVLVTPEEIQNDAEYKPLSSVYLINDGVAKGYTPPVAPVNTEDRLTVDVDEYELPFE